MRPSVLIGEADRERIERAVREAESGTSGEIVVSIVRRCSRHSVAPWRLGALLAAIVLLGSTYLPIEMRVLHLFLLQVCAVLLAHFLCRIDAVRHAFVSEAELQRKVEAAAFAAFAAHGIRKTEGRTGILIFVSLLEHRVVVLGDEAVNAVLDPEESWQDVVQLVLDGIVNRNAVEGILAAVRRCGEILARPLPKRVDDHDEIPHGLILSE